MVEETTLFGDVIFGGDGTDDQQGALHLGGGCAGGCGDGGCSGGGGTGGCGSGCGCSS